MSGSARTTARPVVYVNYYILVDTSQSMGIASTQADMNTLWNLVIATNNQSDSEPSCVFGCHVIQGPQKQTNETLAHNNGVTLRIDSAVTAVKTIISQAQSIPGTTKNIKFGLFTLQADPNTGVNFHIVATPTNDYTALQSAASAIDLGDNNSNGRGDTDMSSELASFNNWLTTNLVTANGSGASAASPLNYFLLVTDGVVDTFAYCNGHSHCTGPVNVSDCNQLKNKGTVGIVYTTYNPIWANNNPSANVLEANYASLVNSFASQIQPNLQSCATTTDFFFQASDGPDIVTAM